MQEVRRHKVGVWYTLRLMGGVYYIFWSENRRSKRESTRQKDLAAADAYLDEWLRLRGQPEAGRRLTCADLYEGKYGLGTDRASMAWRNLGPTFGEKAPIEVTQALVDRYIADRRAGRIGRTKARPSTIRFEIACLYASWNWAAHRRRKLLRPTDLPDLEPPPPSSPRRERWLDEAELEALFAAAAGDPGEIFLWLALDTAGRRTAVCELRWETGQIDFDAANGVGVVHLNPPGRLQTRKRRASVPMSPRLREVLLRARQPSGLVCGIVDPQKANRLVARVAREAGLEKVTPHVLRHTAATHMAKRGVSLWIIAQVLGITLKMAEETYAKFAPSFAADAVGLIGGPAIRPRAIEH